MPKARCKVGHTIRPPGDVTRVLISTMAPNITAGNIMVASMAHITDTADRRGLGPRGMLGVSMRLQTRMQTRMRKVMQMWMQNVSRRSFFSSSADGYLFLRLFRVRFLLSFFLFLLLMLFGIFGQLLMVLLGLR